MFWTVVYFIGAALFLAASITYACTGKHAQFLDSAIWTLAMFSSALMRMWGYR